MRLHLILLVSLVSVQSVFGQVSLNSPSTLNVTGDAAVNVAPDRVRLFVGVESRDQNLLTAKADNDAAVRNVIEAVRALSVAPADIQTDYIRVDMSYDGKLGTIVNYYRVTKDVQILLRNVQQFEEILSRVLLAGANHIYDVEFSTSELRKHRDAARALAIKAAQEKASDLAAAAGGYGQAQNVIQNAGSGGDGIGADGTVALGKISVTASVSMTFQLQPQ